MSPRSNNTENNFLLFHVIVEKIESGFCFLTICKCNRFQVFGPDDISSSVSGLNKIFVMYVRIVLDCSLHNVYWKMGEWERRDKERESKLKIPDNNINHLLTESVSEQGVGEMEEEILCRYSMNSIDHNSILILPISSFILPLRYLKIAFSCFPCSFIKACAMRHIWC